MDNYISTITKLIIQMNYLYSSKDIDLEYNVIVTLLSNVIYDYLNGEIILNQVISILEDIEEILFTNATPPHD